MRNPSREDRQEHCYHIEEGECAESRPTNSSFRNSSNNDASMRLSFREEVIQRAWCAQLL